ncbi:hypothetical protein BDF20DRAFT_811246, partial [Mycotypha africana]|uniref:uncharacterized protein n=1 Tax=Mycotypha africana TaxID=64632 RepID=UPI0023001D81
LTKAHAIECLQMHNRLQLPTTVVDPIFHLLNQLYSTHKTACQCPSQLEYILANCLNASL